MNQSTCLACNFPVGPGDHWVSVKGYGYAHFGCKRYAFEIVNKMLNKHDGMIDLGELKASHEMMYTGKCSCGWVGITVKIKELATRDLEKHLAASTIGTGEEGYTEVVTEEVNPTCVVCANPINERVVNYNNNVYHEFCWRRSANPTLPDEEIKSYDGKVASRQSNLGYHLLGWEAMRQVGEVCLEGDRTYHDKAINGKYISNLLGMDPKELDKWIDERFNHALDHFRLAYQGHREELHWAKVIWFAMVMIELEHAKSSMIREKL